MLIAFPQQLWLDKFASGYIIGTLPVLFSSHLAMIQVLVHDFEIANKTWL